MPSLISVSPVRRLLSGRRVRLLLSGTVVTGLGLGAVAPCPAAVSSGKPAFTDPAAAASADPDFAIQGEYVGTVPLESQELPLGVQLVARGAGRFGVAVYPGGLPGEGWDEGEVFRGTGVRAGEGPDAVVSLEVQDPNGATRRAEVREGAIVVRTDDGTEVARLHRAERASPTLGAKPPEGAVVIFDGDGPADESATLVKAQVTDDGLLREGVVTAADFGDATWHVEFRLPYQPEDEGQQRANSGVYVGGCYEVQVLDSFGLEGLSNECGGIYGAAAPWVNMCLPPLVWQTYDIDYTAPRFEEGKKVANARMTVRHNGVVIHDDRELPQLTPGGPRSEEGASGPLFLQDHGNPVRFRNVWVKPKD